MGGNEGNQQGRSKLTDINRGAAAPGCQQQQGQDDKAPHGV